MIFIPSSVCSNKENNMIADRLNLLRKNDDHASDKGYVTIIKENRNGDREILLPENNHIVLNGRLWVMQKALNQNYSKSIEWRQRNIFFFGCGCGGALQSNPLIPLDIADTDKELKQPLIIKPKQGLSAGGVTETGEHYSDDGYKKNLHRNSTSPDWFQMNFSEARGEVLCLATLSLDFDDVPYEGNTAPLINEFGLYCSDRSDSFPNTKLEPLIPDEYNLFTKYTRPSISKSNNDKLLINWYIFF